MKYYKYSNTNVFVLFVSKQTCGRRHNVKYFQAFENFFLVLLTGIQLTNCFGRKNRYESQKCFVPLSVLASLPI